MDISTFKQKINIKYFMVVYLAALFIFAVLTFATSTTLWKGLLMLALYAVFDLSWTYIRDKIWYFPLSSLISGLVLTIVAKPDLPLWTIFLLPLLAVFSKQLLHFGKIRHVFNPAALAMVVVSFFIPTVSWWATGWDFLPIIIVMVLSAFILWRQSRWHVAVPFWLAYSFLLMLYLLAAGVKSADLPEILRIELMNGSLLFFSTVMLIEPLTSTFPTNRQQMIYALLVAILAIIATALIKVVHWGNLDPLLLGLLGGDLVASLLFLPSHKKVIIDAKK